MLFPDGLLSTPAWTTAWAVAAAALLYAAARARETFPARRGPLFAGTAGLVFALQLVHFPLWTLESGGRFLGGALAAILLGPWAGMLAAALALAAKALLYHDGGLAALGMNILNVAVIGAGAGFRAYTDLRRLLRRPWGAPVAGFLAAVASNAAIAIAMAVELQLGRIYPVWAGLPTLLMVLASVGVVEGLMTFAWIGLARRFAPGEEDEGAAFTDKLARLGLATTLLFTLAFSPLMAARADAAADPRSLLGAEFEFVPLEPTLPALRSPLLGYRFPGLESPAAARALSGMLGLCAVWGLAYAAARAGKRED